jgi:hypothetical protein
MKKFVTVALATIIGCGVPSIVHAQAKKGDKEVQISGNMSSLLSAGGQNTSGQIRFGIGFFVSDRLELGVAPLIRVSSTTQPAIAPIVVGGRIIQPGSDGSTTMSADAGMSTFLQYSFGAKSSRLKPYLGGTFVIDSFKTNGFGTIADNTYAGATAGVKNYLTEKAALDFQGTFGFRPNAPGEFQLLGFNVGITYIF